MIILISSDIKIDRSKRMEKLIVYFLLFPLSYSSKPSELSIPVNSPITRPNETNPGVSFTFYKCLIIILHTWGSQVANSLNCSWGKWMAVGTWVTLEEPSFNRDKHSGRNGKRWVGREVHCMGLVKQSAQRFVQNMECLWKRSFSISSDAPWLSNYQHSAELVEKWRAEIPWMNERTFTDLQLADISLFHNSGDKM